MSERDDEMQVGCDPNPPVNEDWRWLAANAPAVMAVLRAAWEEQQVTEEYVQLAMFSCADHDSPEREQASRTVVQRLDAVTVARQEAVEALGPPPEPSP